eukprot:2611739-Rhodomonas_salina.2
MTSSTSYAFHAVLCVVDALRTFSSISSLPGPPPPPPPPPPPFLPCPHSMQAASVTHSPKSGSQSHRNLSS